MNKVIFALIISAVVVFLGQQYGGLAWVGAAVLCICLETTLFKNIVFFIPAAVGAAGTLAQFSTGNVQTALIASLVAALGMTALLYKELTHDKKAEEKARLVSMRKVRGYQH
jgi:hypothetical protein